MNQIARYLLLSALCIGYPIPAVALLSPGQGPGLGAPSSALQQRVYYQSQIEQSISPDETTPKPVISIEQPPDTDKITPKVSVAVEYCSCGAWRLTLTFPKQVTFTELLEPNSLYLEFNQSIATDDLETAGGKLDFLLRRLETGTHSLYLEAKVPICFRVDAQQNVIGIDLTPNYSVPITPSQTLKLARARYLIEARCYAQAFDALRDYLTEWPCDRDGLMLLAGLEGLLPNWKRAEHILRDILRRMPYDEDARDLLRDTLCPHTSFVRFQKQLQRTVGFAAEHLYLLQGEWKASHRYHNTWYLGGLMLAERGHISEVVNTDTGITEGFLGTRYGGGIYARNEFDTGMKVAGRFWLQERGIYGGGGDVSWLWPLIKGDVTFSADWHKPYWELFETLAFFGREDKLAFLMNGIWNRYVIWDFGGGIHRMGIEHVPNGLISWFANANVFLYGRVLTPQIAFNYGLDSEWITHQAVRTGIDGESFNPVPLDSYEYHSLRLYFFYELRERWYFTMFGGETFNRLGTNDWTGGITLRYVKPCPCGTEVELSAIRYPSTTVQGAVAQYITATVTLRF